MTVTSRFALAALGAFALVTASAIPVAHSKDPIPEVTVTVHNPTSKSGWNVSVSGDVKTGEIGRFENRVLS